uniref:EGF-like domain-containing protein n=1 Tax=Angiostrongylus cantonensis TaxID=6313 RepID=A0A0K0DNS1_ANGCA
MPFTFKKMIIKYKDCKCQTGFTGDSCEIRSAVPLTLTTRSQRQQMVIVAAAVLLTFFMVIFMAEDKNFSNRKFFIISCRVTQNA